MPELPEVQTVVRGLQKRIISKRIVDIIEYRVGTVLCNIDYDALGKVISISRRGKYIIIETDENLWIIVHLRMTGKLIYEKNPELKSSHTRAEIIFADDSKLVFDDVRTFGKIEVVRKDDSLKSLDSLGKEPLADDFDYHYLKEKFHNRKSPIKNILMNQTIIAGLGNIYAAEILFRCKLNPMIEARELKIAELKAIVKETKKVLQEAIKHNGTTISDYRSIEDKTGEFQNFLNVYGKEKCSCGSNISKIKQAGRTTFFCPKCQPEQV